MTAAPGELPMPGVATMDIPSSDVASAIQLGIRESTRETRRQVREECRAIAEEFQENVRLAMREQLQAFDDRYAHRSEVQELRAEVRHLASTIERMQLGRQIAPCTRLGVADNPITARCLLPLGETLSLLRMLFLPCLRTQCIVMSQVQALRRRMRPRMMDSTAGKVHLAITEAMSFSRNPTPGLGTQPNRQLQDP